MKRRLKRPNIMVNGYLLIKQYYATVMIVKSMLRTPFKANGQLCIYD